MEVDILVRLVPDREAPLIYGNASQTDCVIRWLALDRDDSGLPFSLAGHRFSLASHRIWVASHRFSLADYRISLADLSILIAG